MGEITLIFGGGTDKANGISLPFLPRIGESMFLQVDVGVSTRRVVTDITYLQRSDGTWETFVALSN